jgi:hypothetical protein
VPECDPEIHIPAANYEPIVPEVLVSVSRAGRKRRAPQVLRDFLPTSVSGLPSHIARPPPRKPPETLPAYEDPIDNPIIPEPLHEPTVLDIEPNHFGVFRRYTTKPCTDPEDELTLDSFCDAPTLATVHSQNPQSENPLCIFGNKLKNNFFAPFLNATVFRLMKWFYDKTATVSSAALDRLVHDVILAEDFNPEDLRDFSAARELKRLDEYDSTGEEFSANDGWQHASVSISLPHERSKFASEAGAPAFEVQGIYYRRLIEVVKAAYQSTTACKYHWVPFKLFHKPDPIAHDDPDLQETWIFTELYNSDAMIEEDAKIHALPREPGDDADLEIAIAPIMVWSDSTHLANFGTASLWPIYVFFGSLSKYFRAKPSSFAAHHLAYIPSVRFIGHSLSVVAFIKYSSASAHISRLLQGDIQHTRYS